MAAKFKGRAKTQFYFLILNILTGLTSGNACTSFVALSHLKTVVFSFFEKCPPLTWVLRTILGIQITLVGQLGCLSLAHR